jgi:hypothetical protein
MFLAELNKLNFGSTNIRNAYLESNAMEKIYIVGGKEFEWVRLNGNTLVIVKALFGLKTSGMCWWGVLADVLCQMGFMPSKKQIKMSGSIQNRIPIIQDKNTMNTSSYAWMTLELCQKNHSRESIIKEFEECYGFNLKSIGPTT